MSYLGDFEDPQQKLFDYASKLRQQGQEHIVTVAAGALTISVTFRTALLQGAPKLLWALKGAWMALTLCVLAVVFEKLVNSRFMTETAASMRPPGVTKKWIMAALYLTSIVGFAVGVLGLASFGLANL